MPNSRSRRPRAFPLAAALLVAFLIVSGTAGAAPEPRTEPVADLVPPAADGRLPVIFSTHAGPTLAERIRELGGTVSHIFENEGLVSAMVSEEALAVLQIDARVESVTRQRWVHRAVVEDPMIPGLDGLRRVMRAGRPAHREDARMRTRSIDPLGARRGDELMSFQGYEPITRSAEVGELAHWGEGSVVAIIDTGVYDHPLYQGNLIGGFNLVPPEEEMAFDLDGDGIPDGRHFDWDALENGGHGTFVAGVIAGHAMVEFDESDPVLQIMRKHAPESVELDGAGGAALLLQGLAPAASLYGVKVFPYARGSAPDARVAQAIDHLITAKRDGTVDVDIINMSLSGPVLNDGRNPLDRMVDAATRAGITSVVAASNTGPSQMTVGSPASAFTALAVGGALDPIHTRVEVERTFGLPGEIAFPHDDPQIVQFSAIGPTGDHRLKPDIIGAAFQLFSSTLADFDGDRVNDTATYWFGSGTSFSTPTVAGAAAMVAAYARSIGQPDGAPHVARALKEGAQPIAGFDRVSRRKQGHGFVQLPDAFAAVRAELGGRAGAAGAAGAAASLEETVDDDRSGKQYRRLHLRAGHAEGQCPPLGPGETYDFYVRVPDDLWNLHVAFPTVGMHGEQNPLLGDGLQVAVHTAKRGGAGDYVYFNGGVLPGDSFDFRRVHPESGRFRLPEPGFIRITMAGSPVNYGMVWGSFTIDAERMEVEPDHRIDGRIGFDGMNVHTVEIPGGLDALAVRLVWPHDWDHFPTYDLDLFIQTPAGFFPAATLNSPEFEWIQRPPSGEWTFVVMDFSSVRGRERYELQIAEVVEGDARLEVARASAPQLLGLGPNPAAAGTALRFQLPRASHARMDVFDVAGRLVRTVVDGPVEAGRHDVVWDGRSSAGTVAADGVYFVQLRTEGGASTRKVVVRK